MAEYECDFVCKMIHAVFYYEDRLNIIRHATVYVWTLSCSYDPDNSFYKQIKCIKPSACRKYGRELWMTNAEYSTNKKLKERNKATNTCSI